MKRVTFITILAAALSFVYAQMPLAEPAPQPGTTQKAPAKKAKEKAAEPRVEGSYTSEAEAKKACADGAVVWVNSASKIYHAAGTRDYGKTRRGFYMCQAQAERSGFRAVKGPAQKDKKDKKKDAKKSSDKS